MSFSEYVILGCGVSGLCAAKLLVDAGKSDILVLDQYPEPGGNQISCEVNGFTYDIGAFYFWPTMPFFQIYPQVLEKCPMAHIWIQRVGPSGTIGPFPFSFKQDFIDRGPLYWLHALSSVALARLRIRKFVTVEDFTLYWMGRKLYTDLGMADYLIRFCGLPANHIEAEFATSRMEWLATCGMPTFWLRSCCEVARRSFFSNSDRDKDRNKPKEIVIVRPESGFSQMYGVAVQSLRERGVSVRLNQAISSISKEGTPFKILVNGELIRTNNLINTLPINRICKYLGIRAGCDLEYINLATLFISFEGRRMFDAPIFYNWGRLGRWKRLTMHSDYYGPRAGKEYANVEVPLFRCDSPIIKDIYDDFVKSTRNYGIFQGHLSLEGYQLVENAYPAYVLGAGKKVSHAIAELEALGVQSVGRQGRFDYLPTGMHVFNQVVKVLKI